MSHTTTSRTPPPVLAGPAQRHHLKQTPDSILHTTGSILPKRQTRSLPFFPDLDSGSLITPDSRLQTPPRRGTNSPCTLALQLTSSGSTHPASWITLLSQIIGIQDYVPPTPASTVRPSTGHRHTIYRLQAHHLHEAGTSTPNLNYTITLFPA